MRRTFAHHENHIITLGSALTRLHVRNVTARSSWRGCAKSTFSLEKSPSLKKTTEIGKLAAIKPGEIAAMVQCRVSFFKDLVSSDGHPSSCLQQSIEISGAENVTSATWWHPAVRYESKDVFGSAVKYTEMFQKKFNALPDFTNATAPVAHAGFPTTCEQCHDTVLGTDAKSDHSTTGVPLVGAHTVPPRACAHRQMHPSIARHCPPYP